MRGARLPIISLQQLPLQTIDQHHLRSMLFLWVELHQNLRTEWTLWPKLWTSCRSSKWIDGVTHQLAHMGGKMPFRWCWVLPHEWQCRRSKNRERRRGEKKSLSALSSIQLKHFFGTQMHTEKWWTDTFCSDMNAPWMRVKVSDEKIRGIEQ